MRPRKPLTRRKPLARSPKPIKTASPKRGKGERKPLKPVNKERRAKNLERSYGPPSRRAWISAQPCRACTMGPCDNAHVGGVAEGAGTGHKSGAEWVIPLCKGPHGCHAILHKIGVASFERQSGIDLKAEAVKVEAAWAAHTGAGTG